MNNIGATNKSKIKILYIAPSLDAGGAERFLIDLMTNLNRSEFDFSLLLFAHAGFFFDELSAQGVEIKVLHKRWKFDPINFYLMYRTVQKNRPDIVHTQLGGDIYGRLLAKILGIKVIVSTEVDINREESFFLRQLKTWTAKFAAKIVAVSDAVRRDVIQRYHVAADRVQIIYNGLDVQKFSKSARPDKQRSKIIFGGMGRLAPAKNWSTLLQAIALMKNKNIECLIAGTGALRPELEKLVLELELKGRVKFIGLVKDVPAFMSNLDFFVLPSKREAFGIVLIEAGLLGVPVLASNIDGIPEIIKDEERGILFDPMRSDDLAKKLDWMIANIHSAEVDNMTLALQNFVRDNFDIKNIALQYEDLYKDLLLNKI